MEMKRSFSQVAEPLALRHKGRQTVLGALLDIARRGSSPVILRSGRRPLCGQVKRLVLQVRACGRRIHFARPFHVHKYAPPIFRTGTRGRWIARGRLLLRFGGDDRVRGLNCELNIIAGKSF